MFQVIAKKVDELIHGEELQKEIREALLANSTECGPFTITELKDLWKEGKKPHCTICSVDVGRGLRNEVIIPNECLVEEMF
ncbi:MAG: hypothetical protein PUC65_02070 [Clostridiales bacterium]|nr:hypothetical protein [Clostridiales bacterium]